MIAVEFRRTIYSEKGELAVFEPGVTIAEIVARFDKPLEFSSHGSVMIRRGEERSHLVYPQYWERFRPRDGTAIFISIDPQGGGGGGGGKNVFRMVAAIALMVLTIAISAGGLAWMAPAIFGAAFQAGGAGAIGAAALVSGAGSMALNLLTRPTLGAPAGGAAAGIGSAQGLGVAGIAQNPIGAWQPLPWPAGQMRVSPVILTQFTTNDGNDQVLHLVAAMLGPCSIDATKINENDVADLADGVAEIETREGWPDDPPLTLVTRCGFQENINLPMSVHRLEADDQASLLAPASGSYPKPHIFRMARDADSFRLTLSFGGGLANYNNETAVAVAFRLRVRRVGDEDWRLLPELHVNASRREGFRQEIWLRFGGAAAEAEIAPGALLTNILFKRLYFKNAEWTADGYFDPGGGGALNPAPKHVYPDPNGVTVFLDTADFPRGQYDVEIVRSFADAAGNFSETVYTAGLFTRRTVSGGIESIPAQRGIVHGVTIESYTTFRDQYPVNMRGAALLAARVRNMQVNSISAMFGPYVETWNGENWDTVAVSSNPAALLRHVWLKRPVNRRPVKAARLEDLSPFYSHCDDKGLTCKFLLTDSSVEAAGDLIAACGDAAVRRSDKYGVIIDKDRSEEPIRALFTPANMTTALTITKHFNNGAQAIVPHFNDETRDFAARDLDRAVFDEGVPLSPDMRVEMAPYEGSTTEYLVARRALMELRRRKWRTRRYSWGVHLEHLDLRNGVLVAVAHDMLRDTYGFGRIAGFTLSGGFLRDVTLDNDVADLPVTAYDGLFEVDRVLTLAQFFALYGPPIGIQIGLPFGGVSTLPVEGVAGRTLRIAGDIAPPAGLRTTLIAGVGLRGDTVQRAVILSSIKPRNKQFAMLEGFDAAPEIFKDIDT